MEKTFGILLETLFVFPALLFINEFIGMWAVLLFISFALAAHNYWIGYIQNYYQKKVEA